MQLKDVNICLSQPYLSTKRKRKHQLGKGLNVSYNIITLPKQKQLFFCSPLVDTVRIFEVFGTKMSSAIDCVSRRTMYNQQWPGLGA